MERSNLCFTEYLFKKKEKRGHYRELGSNYLLISRDFKNCMVIRAIYFKVLQWLIDNCYQVTIIFISGYVEIIRF